MPPGGYFGLRQKCSPSEPTGSRSIYSNHQLRSLKCSHDKKFGGVISKLKKSYKSCAKKSCIPVTQPPQIPHLHYVVIPIMTFKQKVSLLQSGAALEFFLDFVPLTQSTGQLFYSVFLHLRLSGCLVIRFGLCICGRDSVDVKLGSCHRVPSSGTVSMCPRTGDVYFDHLIIKVELPRFLHCQVTLFLFVFNKGLPGAVASALIRNPLNPGNHSPILHL